MMIPTHAVLLLQFPDGSVGWIRGDVDSFTIETTPGWPTRLTVETWVHGGIEYGPPPPTDEAFGDRGELPDKRREIDPPIQPTRLLPGARDA